MKIEKIDKAIRVWEVIRELQKKPSLEHEFAELYMRVLNNEKVALTTHEMMYDIADSIIKQFWDALKKYRKYSKKEMTATARREYVRLVKEKAQQIIKKQKKQLIPIKEPDLRLWGRT